MTVDARARKTNTKCTPEGHVKVPLQEPDER